MPNRTAQLRLRDSKARKYIFSEVRKLYPDKKSIKLPAAILLYVAHHNINTNGMNVRVWLYDHSEVWLLYKANPKTKKDKPINKLSNKLNVSATKIPFGVSFYMSKPWRTLRAKAIKHYGCTCMRCGYRNTKNHVDHIYPRSKYPQLELEFCNLQILCEKCNSDKSNTVIYDMRPPSAKKWQDELKSRVKGYYHQPKLAMN